MLRDFGWGWRKLAKSPGFTATAVLVLALGIGVNATIFTIIDALLLKPVKVRRPEELAGIYQHDREHPDDFSYFSYPDFADLRSAKDGPFTDLFAFGSASVGLRGEFDQRVGVSVVSANYFSALGVAPAMGRVFLPEEETSGATAAVLTHDFWKRLGGDPAILGRKLKLTQGELTVVGVMPAGFSGAQVLSPQLFVPVGMAGPLFSAPGQTPPAVLTSRAERRFMVMGRLKPGVTLANVAGPLSVLNRGFEHADPSLPAARVLMATAPSRFNITSTPPRENGGLAAMAAFSLVLSALVLVIACLNLANMMLARGAARRKEVAIRLALGAARARILRQLLGEGLLLAALGGVAGLVLSAWSTRLLSNWIYSGAGMPPDFPKFDFSPDWRVLLVLFLLSGLATVCFALGPAWKLAALDLNGDLKRNAGEDTGDARPRRFGARECLAAGQMAAALALLVAATLFCRSAIQVAAANPGFEFGSNFYAEIDPSLADTTEARVRGFSSAALDRLAALPGVEAVSFAMNTPFNNRWWMRPVQRGGTPPDAPGDARSQGRANPIYNVVGPNYFRTLGITLQRGREFDRHETEATNAPPVAILSDNLAEALWPGEDAVGRTIQMPGALRGGALMQMTVVGVVRAVHWDVFEKEPPANVYVPFGQDFQSNIRFHVRVAPGANAAGLMGAARAELRRLDPQIPLTEIKTLAAMHHDGPSVRVVSLGSVLFGAFGVLALCLTLLGVYGLKAYSVARRTREIGIRMALGASARGVVRMIVRETVWLAGVGLGLGLLVAWALGRAAGRFLYEAPAADPIAYGLMPLLLLGAAVAACLLPARRAARVSPLVALRHE